MEKISDFYTIHISRQGFSHIKAEEEAIDIGRKFPCQDRSSSGVFNGNEDIPAFCFAAVSDGHGSAPHFRSDKGAEFAVQTMCECVEIHVKKISELQSKSEINSELNILTNEICSKWKSKVLADISQNPITETELKYLSQEIVYEKYLQWYKKGVNLENVYGCTALLIVSIPEKKLWFAIQIGDGDIVIKKKGGIAFEKPIPDDESVGSETFSLCDENASELFKHTFGINEELSVAFCSSDGIFNSFNSNKALYNFYNTVIEQFCYSDRGEKENDNIPLRVKSLTEELANYLDDLSRNGSHDDMSVSGFLEITKDRILGHKNSKHLINYGISDFNQAGIESNIDVKIKLYDSSIKKFQEAAKNGFPEGYMWGGRALSQKAKLEGKNELSNVQILFQRAIDGGCLEAKKYLGQIQCQEAKYKLNEKKFQDALNLFSKAAENDFSEANYYLSKIYKNPKNFGGCAKENIQKSFNCLKKSATGGFTEAEFEIAKCYAEGNPIPANSEIAAEYFEKVLKQVRENRILETEEFSKIVVLKTIAKFYARTGSKKAIDLCNAAFQLAPNDVEVKSIFKDISSIKQLQNGSFPRLIKNTHSVDLDSEDEKKETPQFNSGQEIKQSMQKVQKNENQSQNISLFHNHIQPMYTTTEQQLTGVEQINLVNQSSNNSRKLPTTKQTEKVIKDLQRKIINAIQKLSIISDKSKMEESCNIRSNLSKIQKELNTSNLDKNKKPILVIQAREYLQKAELIFGEIESSENLSKT